MHSKWGWCAGCTWYISCFCTLHRKLSFLIIVHLKTRELTSTTIVHWMCIDVDYVTFPVNVNDRGVNLAIYENQRPLLCWNVAVNLIALFPFPGGGGWYTSYYTQESKLLVPTLFGFTITYLFFFSTSPTNDTPTLPFLVPL